MVLFPYTIILYNNPFCLSLQHTGKLIFLQWSLCSAHWQCLLGNHNHFVLKRVHWFPCRMITISMLMEMSDWLFRNADLTTRRKYVDLTDSIKGNGGDVHIFSSMHVSGERNFVTLIIVCSFYSTQGFNCWSTLSQLCLLKMWWLQS